MTAVEVQVGDDRFPAVEPARTREPGAFAALLDDLADHSRRGELVLLTGPPSAYGPTPAGFPEHRWFVGSLVRSVGDDCAVAILDWLNGAPAPQELGLPPLLVSNRAAIRYVAASADDIPDGAITETPRHRKDFSAFVRLWGGEPEPEVPGEFGRELMDRMKFVGIGEIIGELHRDGATWQDAHLDQFGCNRDHFPRHHGWFVYDLIEHVSHLYRPPCAAESAANLLPILAELRPSQYPWLRSGYVSARGAGGAPVFDLIESGDLTGWRQALRDDQPDLATERLAAQIAADHELSAGWRQYALTQAGIAFSRAGLHDDAARAYEEVLACCTDPASSDYRMARFNWSQARRRAGDLEAARQGLEEVLALETADPTVPELQHQAALILQRIREDATHSAG